MNASALWEASLHLTCSHCCRCGFSSDSLGCMCCTWQQPARPLRGAVSWSPLREQLQSCNVYPPRLKWAPTCFLGGVCARSCVCVCVLVFLEVLLVFYIIALLLWFQGCTVARCVCVLAEKWMSGCNALPLMLFSSLGSYFLCLH